jgi:hypothetical protein
MTKPIGDITRRDTLRAGALAATVAVGGSLVGFARAVPDDWDSRSFDQQLRYLRARTHRYRRVSAADADGYVSAALPLYCGVGYHFDKESAWEGENAPDPDTPGSLFYVLDDNDELRLAGVEYLLVTELDEEGEPVDPMPDLFNDEQTDVEADPLFGRSEADGWELIVDPATGFTVWDLHVWLHEENPAGVFTHTHPSYEDLPTCVPLDLDEPGE